MDNTEDRKIKTAKKRKTIWLAAMAAVMLLVAGISVVVWRGQDKAPRPAEGDTVTTITGTVTPAKETDVPTAAPTGSLPTPLVTIGDTNPLQMEGYEYFADEEADNAHGDVYLKARVACNTTIKGQYLYGLTVYSYEDNVLFSYETGNVNLDSDLWLDEEIHIQTVAGAIFREDGKVETAALEADTTQVSYQNGFVYLLERKSGATTLYVYDSSFEKTAEMELPYSESYAYSTDGERVYFSKSHVPYVCERNGTAKKIVLTDCLLVQRVDDVLTDSKGTDYLLLYVQAEDLEMYYAVVNAATGETVYLSAGNDSYLGLRDDLYIETVYNKETFINQKWIISGEQGCYEYVWEADENIPFVSILPGGHLLFVQMVDAATFRLYLFSYETNQLIADTELSVPMEMSSDIEGEFGVFFHRACMGPNGTEVLLQIQDAEGNYCYYIWKLKDTETASEILTVRTHETGSRPSAQVVARYDFSMYTPSPVRAELEPLRERADALEAAFGIEIRIGEECADMIGGYAILPMTDYTLTEAALDALEEELSKYPDGFLQQLSREFYDANVFCLAGEIRGIQEYVLEDAGGFCCVYENAQILVMDARYAGTMGSTVHHELFHMLERYMQQLAWERNTVYLDENEWLALNPPSQVSDTCYTYSYSQFGYAENMKFVYNIAYYVGGNLSDVYFVDTYSMTFPGEDRARIFESAMDEGIFHVDFDAVPNLKAKLDYLAQCIREAFDTTGWENVPWEK